MKPVSLIAVASELPATIVDQRCLSPRGEARPHVRAAYHTTSPAAGRNRRRVPAAAPAKLIDKLNLTPARDVDLLFTNVSVPDEPFTGCGAEVARAISVRARNGCSICTTPVALRSST